MGAQLISFVYLLLVILGMCMLGLGSFGKHSKNGWHYVLAIFISIVSAGYVAFVDEKMAIIIAVPELVVFILLFEGRIWKRICYFIEMYLMYSFVLVTVLAAIQMLGGTGISVALLKLINAAVLDILLCVIVRREWYRKFVHYLKALSKTQYIALAIIIFGMVVLFSVSKEIENNLVDLEFLYIFRGVVLLEIAMVFAGIIWFVRGIYRSEYYYKQNQLKEEVIETQQQYYQLLFEKDREVRAFQHDISSQLGCLKLFLDKQDIDGSREYLRKIEDEFSKTVVNKYCVGNELVDVIINRMYARAREKGITIEVNGMLGETAMINPYDLCTIFSNALSNGIEACEQMANAEKIIVVSLLQHNGTFMCKFVNPATLEMYQAIGGKRTRKPDAINHGLGIMNIQMAVERSHGSVEYSYQDGKITLEVCI